MEAALPYPKVLVVNVILYSIPLWEYLPSCPGTRYARLVRLRYSANSEVRGSSSVQPSKWERNCEAGQGLPRSGAVSKSPY